MLCTPLTTFTWIKFTLTQILSYETNFQKGTRCSLKRITQGNDIYAFQNWMCQLRPGVFFCFVLTSWESAEEVCQDGCSHFSSDSPAFSPEEKKNFQFLIQTFGGAKESLSNKTAQCKFENGGQLINVIMLCELVPSYNSSSSES